MVYVIKSSSFRMLNSKIQELTGELNEKKYFNLSYDELDDVIIDASYVGLFNEARAIIVREVNYFGGKNKYEDQVNSIIRLIENLDPSITLILVCNNLLKTKDSTKKLLGLNVEYIDIFNNSEVESEYLKKYLESKELKVDSKAMDKLNTNTCNNIDLLLNELDKLSLISKDITFKVVSEYSSTYIIPKDEFEELDYNDISFKFVDALINKKFKDTFAYFDKVIERGDDMYSLIGLINSSYSNIYMVKEALSHGMSDEEIMNEFGYKKIGRVFIMKKNGNIYSLDELRDIIVKLSDIDLKIKLGADPINSLKEFILSV
jgi:DNA polymerase III delta subunit